MELDHDLNKLESDCVVMCGDVISVCVETGVFDGVS